IVAHPDLVKVWGPPPHGRPVPDTDLRRYYEPTVEAMLDAGVAMEVSTAGLRKPVAEIYPARAMLEMAVDAGLPIALSSDAHLPAGGGRRRRRERQGHHRRGHGLRRPRGGRRRARRGHARASVSGPRAAGGEIARLGPTTTVEGLAPDAASLAAARRLARPGP